MLPKFFSALRPLIAAASLSLALPSFAASEPSLITGQKKSFGYSWQQELKLGAEADKEITEEMGLYDNPQIQAYVDEVGQRVLRASNFYDPNAPQIYRDTKFTFRVMDSPVVNAFALPGGYVYVTRGLLSHVQNEAQLATVLGHEIAHIAARHSSQQARRSQWSQIGVIAGAILGQKVLGEKMPNIGETILQGGGQAAQMFLTRYSREAEHESDSLGVSYASRAGYAAGDSARFFESLKRISAAEGKSLPSWQSTHPDPGDRAQRVVQIASQVNPNAARGAGNLGEEEFLRRIEGIVVGENPREGFAHNGVFYHPELRFQMPVAQGWKFENQKAAVVMAEPNGRAMMGLRMAAGSRAREAATQFAQQSKVQVTSSGDTQVNGLPTHVIIGQASTEQGTVGVWNAFIEMDNKVYSLLGYAPAQVFNQMRPTFESVTGGFSPLRDMNLTNVQPARLKIVRADRNAPFASFVPTSLPQSVEAEEVAIMNQVNLNEPVNEGRLLKVPDAPAIPTPQAQPPPEQTYSRYPDQRYPNQYPNQSYPPSQPDYRGQYPSNYPQQTHPPSQSNYPQQQYPSGYPNQNYPQQQPQYPAQTYPQNYPSPSYPQSYPPQPDYRSNPSAPQNTYPQWPQSPNQPQQQNQPRSSQPQPPVWPR